MPPHQQTHILLCLCIQKKKCIQYLLNGSLIAGKKVYKCKSCLTPASRNLPSVALGREAFLLLNSSIFREERRLGDRNSGAVLLHCQFKRYRGNGSKFPLGFQSLRLSGGLETNAMVPTPLMQLRESRLKGALISCVLFPDIFNFHHMSICQSSALPLSQN